MTCNTLIVEIDRKYIILQTCGDTFVVLNILNGQHVERTVRRLSRALFICTMQQAETTWVQNKYMTLYEHIEVCNHS